MKHLIIFFSAITVCHAICAQDVSSGSASYDRAYNELKEMLEGKAPLSFKKAVFTTENAWFDNRLNYAEFLQHITLLKELCFAVMHKDSLIYAGRDRDEITKHAAIFRVMKDTLTVGAIDSTFYIMPYEYDFEDFDGDKEWTKMFVTKLLYTKTGNCHSLPFLYKILAEELGTKAYLAMAPNHTYIKSRSSTHGWYNTELTTGYFPNDAWIMASGYIKLEAVQNGLYMDTLSDMQSVAVCLTDLAKGFEKKYAKTKRDFILQCCELALQHYPNYINALLLKAETIKTDVEMEWKSSGVKYPKDLFYKPNFRQKYEEMEKCYVQIHALGYRNMPKEMYLQWLAELNTHKEKYLNTNIHINQN